MDVSQILKDAMQDVSNASIPKELQETALKEAIALRARAAGVGGGEDAGLDQQEQLPPRDEAGKVAARLDVDPALLADVFDFSGDDVNLVIGARKLDASAAKGAQQIALLIAAARQGAELEEWTSLNTIREWCETYKRYHAGNFARDVGRMDDAFSVKGPSRNREVRVSRPGWEQAADLVKKLTGAE